jgi:SAM-dependent methyltransferase
MGFLGGGLGYRILKWLAPQPKRKGDGQRRDYESCNKVEALLGPDVWTMLRDRVVIDFGCGTGADAIEMARRGAARVIGLDLQEPLLEQARRAAATAGVAQRTTFVRHTEERADVIASLDAFEHFSDPEGILALLFNLLKPGGRLLASFGPTWYHPRGGHLFSVFPWAHLVFTERALLRWRADFSDDGATRFHEVRGGLNGMTVRRFERMVRASRFETERLETVPIRPLRFLANRLTREFTTAVVRAVLRRPAIEPRLESQRRGAAAGGSASAASTAPAVGPADRRTA